MGSSQKSASAPRAATPAGGRCGAPALPAAPPPPCAALALAADRGAWMWSKAQSKASQREV